MMSARDWIAFGSAIVSVLSLLATIFFASRASSAAKSASNTAMGQAETALRTAITVTRQAVRDIGLQIGSFVNGRRRDQLKADEKRRLEAYERPFNEALEDNLNAYEEACSKYIDNKIDRERFRKSYHREIQNLCEAKEENSMYEFLHPADTCRFQCIWTVYREWFHHEK